jgi:hypothetical protein
MRLGCLLPLVSIVLVFGGGQSVYTAVKNRKPTEIAITDLIARKPSAEWLNIGGGVLDTTNASYTSAFGAGEAKSIYVPLVVPGTVSTEGEIHVLVLTKDPDLLRVTNEARKLDDSKAPEAAAAEFLLKNLDQLQVARSVQGLVKFGIEADDKKTRKIRKLYGNLAKDVVILEEGKSPSAAQGIGFLVAGLLLGGFLMRSFARKSAPPPGASPPPLPQ